MGILELRAGWVLWALSSVLASSAVAGAPDPKNCTEKLERAMREPSPAEAEKKLNEASAECGEGHGLLSAMAAAAAAQGNTERAAALCLRALTAPDATAAAVELLVRLFPGLAEPTRREVLSLGTSAEAPIYLTTSMSLGSLVKGVFCDGAPLIGNTETIDRPHHVLRVAIECPRGTVTVRHVRYSSAAPSPQSEARRSIDRLIDETGIAQNFGLRSVAELREALTRPLTADRSQAWLSSRVDLFREKALWALLLKQNPNDLEALVALSDTQARLGDRAQALKTLLAADLTKVELVDARASGIGPSSIASRQCRLLRRQNKLTEANAACRKAIDAGSKVNGPLAWAEVLYLQGKYEEALVQVENGLSADGRNQRGYIVAALINQKLGRLDAASARFNGSFGLSKVLGVSLDDKRSPPEWLALLDRQQDREDATALARCGHLYLDLDMPKQSQTCFAASQKHDPFLAAVARLEHQAETNPREALRAGEALLLKSRDLELLLVMARAHAQAGAPHEGIPVLREALYKLPPWDLPEELIRTVCVDFSLAECMKQSP